MIVLMDLLKQMKLQNTKCKPVTLKMDQRKTITLLKEALI